MKLGFNGGATIRWNTEPNLGIQAELNFTQHGWEEKFEEKPQYKYSRTVNYMELPFLTHIHFGSKRVRVFMIYYCRTFLLDKGIIGSSLYACIQRSFHGCEMIFSQA